MSLFLHITIYATRQGQGTKPENLDEGVETATKWLDEKLKL
jgi:alanyl-tRNA synthetase